MIRILCISFLFIAGICVPASGAATRILFIGNSFTYVGNMPGILAEFCRAKRIPIEIHVCAPGGYTLEAHSFEDKTLEMLAQNWDCVVLQDQSQTPAYSPEYTMRGGKALSKKIKQTKAKTLLFITWGYSKDDGTVDEEMQKKLTGTYCALAKEIGATSVPVGPAWQNALKKNSKFGLYAENDSNCHPSQIGAYFNACIFYAAIFKRPASGLPTSGRSYKVNRATALELQRIADEALKKFVPAEFGGK